MKHAISLYFIFLTLIIQCYTENNSYHPQEHIFVISQQLTHTPSTHFSPHLSINLKTQKNYHSHHLPPAQQLNIIKNWIERYFKPNPIPYGQLPPVIHATETSTPALHENTTKATPQIEPLPEKIPYIDDLQTAVHIQKLCPEWEKHSAILDARSSALEQIKNGNITITTQHHTLSRKMHDYCKAHNIDSEILTQNCGTALQHTIHQEFVIITKKSSKIWHTPIHSKPLRKMTGLIADFTCAGIEYNNDNKTAQAIHLANACWIILDCIQAAGEGLLDGGYHLVDDVMHPVRTAQVIAESAAVCGYYIGKVAIEVGQLGYLASTDNSDEIHKKLDAWKQNFSLIYEAIQEKRSKLKTRDMVKEAVSFGVQCYAAPKVLHGLGKLFKQAHKQVITFANNIPALKKTNALTTPEGVIIRIAENTTEYMKNDLTHINTLKRLTQQEISAIAHRLNFKKTNYYSHGQPVFKRGSLYISYDIDSHNGGVWKMANSVENLKSKRTRMGTYDMNLNRIGD